MLAERSDQQISSILASDLIGALNDGRVIAKVAKFKPQLDCIEALVDHWENLLAAQKAANISPEVARIVVDNTQAGFEKAKSDLASLYEEIEDARKEWQTAIAKIEGADGLSEEESLDAVVLYKQYIDMLPSSTVCDALARRCTKGCLRTVSNYEF